MRGLPIWASIMVLALASCGDASEGDSTRAATSRDSAGVTIVEIDTAAVPRAWSVSERPTWSFDEVRVDGEPHPLLQVFDVSPLPDGRVVFGEFSSRSLLIGDPVSGSFRRIGQAGEGPEEFEGPVTLEVGADGWLTVVDRSRARIVRVDTAGTFGTVLSLSSPGLASPSTAVVGDRFVIKTSGRLDAIEHGIHSPAAPMVAMDWRGNIDTLGVVLDAEYAVGPDYRGLVLLGAFPFTAGSSRGLWYGYSDRARVMRWGPDGLELIVRWTPTASRDNEAFADQARAAMIENVAPGLRDQMRSMVSSFPVSDGVGQFSELVPAEDGGLWIGPYSPVQFVDPVQMAGTWLVLDAEGLPRARVEVPRGFSPSRVGDGFVLGVFHDDLGVEHVQRREILVEPPG